MASCCGKLFSIAREMHVMNFIANSLAFAPPKPVRYTIQETEQTNSKGLGSCYVEVNFRHKDYSALPYPWIKTQAYQLKKCHNKKKIVVLRVTNTSVNPNKKFTILFSHGNSSDLSTIYSFLVDLSTNLKADVISYDYSGYGRSEGRPSEKEICFDIEQVMDCMTKHLHIKEQMGYSLGSVPTMHMSVSKIFNKISGVILIAPLASGMKLVDPQNSIATVDLERVDVFCNLSKASNIDMPVFLIHGKKDTVIPVVHSEELLKKIKYVTSWLPSNCDHDNIISKCRDKFFSRVKTFLQELFYTLKKHNSDSEELTPGMENKVSVVKVIKNIKCEENYMKCFDNINDSKNQKFDNQENLYLNPDSKNEEEYENNLSSRRTPELNSISISKNIMFEVPNSSENLFSTRSVENEGDLIFASSNRISDYHYNYKDAKELEHQFDQIQKKNDN